MCGITGLYSLDGTPATAADAERMADLLVHRGPDGSGSWSDGRCALGHRRLAIIDPHGSPQPMVSADDRYVLAFNGELLNYRALRGRLSYPFRTVGDTETLLAAYATWGVRALDRFEGQFAFAVFDRAEQTLSLFRDQLGILPLYWTTDGHRLAFASEIKALLPFVPGGARVDVECLDEYLTQRSVHAPRTLFAGVHKLPAGHRLVVGPAGQITVSRYWDLPRRSASQDVDPAAAVDLVSDALTEAVTAAFVADVPVGAYLSGGVDSSLICALAAKLPRRGALHTYSAGFASSGQDERPFARSVADLLGTEHHEVVVGPEDLLADWPKLIWHRDAPLSEPADVAVHRLAQLAKPDVTVLLSGEGSDELFGGYRKYWAAQRSAPLWRLPGQLRRRIAGGLDPLLDGPLAPVRSPLQAFGGPTVESSAGAWFSPFSERGRRRLLPQGGSRPGSAVLAEPHGDLRDLLEYDCRTWLPDNLLERGDRMSMAASVEARPPFLAANMVDLAFRLPSAVKVRGGVGKWVVKEVARRHLPVEIVDRSKVGFTVPLDAWFRGALRDTAHDLLTSSDSLAAAVFEPAEVARLLRRHDRGESDEGIRLFTLVGLELWHRTFCSSGVPSLIS